MKILFLSALLPYPLYSGGQIRLYNLLKILSKKHEISLFTFLRDETERENFNKLSFCHTIEAVYRGHAWQPRYVFSSMGSFYSLLFTTYRSTVMLKKLQAAMSLGRYDLVHIEPGYVWLSLPKTTLPIVVSEHNIEYAIYRSYAARFPIIPVRPLLYADTVKLYAQQIQLWNRVQHVTAVSSEDVREIQQHAKTVRTTVVPNGVDLSSFSYTQGRKKNKNPVLLFVGNFSWMQNRDALSYILTMLWPLVKIRIPQATLRVVGKRIPRDLRMLIGEGKATLLEDVSDITVQYNTADILLAPIRMGGGTKFKILEAMASGLPVVATSMGAKGLDLEDGRELLLADTPPEMIDAIESLLTNTTMRNALVRRARERIEVDYNWEHIAMKLESVWTSVT